MNTSAAVAAAAAGCHPPFTAPQWQELEHQALIFKYLMAGIPVPPELLLPIRKSLESMATRFYHHPTMGLGYCSFYGKKMDPEPGRCRRTDGKKWRCSKEAHPDSKYCERHMHRGRNRSRKPVETQSISQPQTSSSSPSSTVTSLAPSGSGTSGGSGGGGVGILSNNGSCSARAGSSSLYARITYLPTHASYAWTKLSSSSAELLPLCCFLCHFIAVQFRYLRGVKSEVDAHSFFAEASGSSRGPGNDFSVESTWRLMPSQVSYTLPKPAASSLLQGSYPHLQPVLDFSHGTVSSLAKQPQHCFFGSEYESAGPVKHESQPLRPFFDEWPKTRDSWSELDDDRSNRTTFSTTQLSISIPMASSDFSTTNSRSPNAED